MMTVNLSFWEKEAFFKEVDVLIIGSGIVGLNAAIAIKERKPQFKVLVIERGVLPIGASTRNAGFACFGSMTELLDDLSTQQAEKVWALVEKRWRGLQRLRERLGDDSIQYRPWGGYELFRPEEKESYEACQDHMEDFNLALRSITGLPATFDNRDEDLEGFGFGGIQHLIYNQGEGQIHTGKMMAQLLALARERGVEVYNGMEVTKLETSVDGLSIRLKNEWQLKAHQVIVATNGFATQLLPELQVRPARNQVLITEPIPSLKIKGTFHYDRGFFYFRNVNDRLLLGGGRCLDLEGEETDTFGLTTHIQNNLQELLNTVILPNTKFQVAQWWSGIMGVGKQKTPVVERLGPHLSVAVRLGGMGVAIGAQTGEEAAKVVLDG
ncbi:MAG: FAD-binding oxidoreductase [Saprospiraceae bacterium]|nr:FAD-binding oxidoreductase [Saprospiraceae bacterium]